VITSKDFKNIAIIINGQFNQFVNQNGNFELDFTVPEDISELQIAGSKDGRQYSGLLKYNVGN